VTGNRAAAPVASPPVNEALPPVKEAPVPAPSATGTRASGAPPLSGVSFEHVNPPSESETSEKGHSWKMAPSPSPHPNSCEFHVFSFHYFWLACFYLFFLILIVHGITGQLNQIESHGIFMTTVTVKWAVPMIVMLILLKKALSQYFFFLSFVCRSCFSWNENWVVHSANLISTTTTTMRHED
jgi:hypothetical protein